MNSLIDQTLMYNNMSSVEELQAQPQSPIKSPRSNMIFPFGNGGFGQINRQKQEDPISNCRDVGPPSFTHQPVVQTESGRRKVFNNNEMRDPWGDGYRMISGVSQPLLNVPPPPLPAQQPWLSSVQYPVRIGDTMSNSRHRDDKEEQVYDYCSVAGSGSGCGSSVSSLPSYTGRPSQEIIRLLGKREYETDRLRKAKEREEKLRREEENIEKQKLYQLKSEVLKLEEKRKQQEWLTHRRQERLIRKKEAIERSDRGRSRSSRRRKSRSKALSPQRSRRSRSRTKSCSRTRGRSRARARSRPRDSCGSHRYTRRRSRSGSRIGFRRKSFDSNSTPTRQKSLLSPKRRILVRREKSAIDRSLVRLAAGKSPYNERTPERHVRYRNSRSLSLTPRVGRAKSKSRYAGSSRQDRRGSPRQDYRGRSRVRSSPRGRFR